ncbi:outer membrane lipid asymmetry maintenance protein MlaD [Deefgea tanakiae]|uniref:Outer membrane lipid asymmetry maintenance protein MlaD n=1 Tax=Deefgea tanakiae TaxID=2865840 RepID=A0ABX8Z738_9NEIS|nr:outer membrane lipid asymmetry maintenance protein MlaD [Deefgea tanakiae]QZA77174.1 outer membrane lipid asymmetry maintenance protein MlaD [Deefgea tanakiae]
MKRGMIDFWVGLFATAGVVALLFLALQVSSSSSLPATSSYTLIANFENIGGLKTRSPIKSAGVVVGRVTSITLDSERYVARVEMALDSRYHFSKDSSAEILTSGLLGEQYIGITPGAEEKNLAAGDAFKVTSSAIVLEQLISRFLFSQADKTNSSEK